MKALKSWRVPVTVCILAGCSSGSGKPPADAPPAAAPPSPTVFDPLTHNLDRAKDVQNTVDQAAARDRQAVDAQERGNAPP
jgi:hypothetical protein